MEENSILLMQKYKLLKKIGSGSFGSIFLCENIDTREKFAAKIEKKGKGNNQLQYEIKLYQFFQGISKPSSIKDGIARLYDCGVSSDRFFMIIDLLGNSLEELFEQCGREFSVATTLNIGIQIITRLEHMHRKGFIHRDIKGNNFMGGRNKKNKIIYIIDFGLSKKYVDSKTGKHIPFRGGKSLVGTARYASIASHDGYEQCRRDDLESLGYLLLYFMLGKLPWQGLAINNKVQKYQEIGKMKKKTSIEQLCLNFNPSSCILADYFNYVKKLQFQEKMFKQELIKNKQQSAPYDWEQQKFLNYKQKITK